MLDLCADHFFCYKKIGWLFSGRRDNYVFLTHCGVVNKKGFRLFDRKPFFIFNKKSVYRLPPDDLLDEVVELEPELDRVLLLLLELLSEDSVLDVDRVDDVRLSRLLLLLLLLLSLEELLSDEVLLSLLLDLRLFLEEDSFCLSASDVRVDTEFLSLLYLLSVVLLLLEDDFERLLLSYDEFGRLSLALRSLFSLSYLPLWLG